MLDGKLDPMIPANARGFRVDPSGGNEETRGILGPPTERRDQVNLDSVIPLSPQWLHVKPNDSKSWSSAASVKDSWRLDGSHDKKDWRRSVPDTGSHRWHEEERETGLLGRRERKKEGDKDNGHRKNERRSDNVPVREFVDSRSSLSSDQRPEVTSRISGHDTRRDSKWFSSWGSEEKEKDSRSERRKDQDREDAFVEKQSSVGTNHLVPESDSRDKWRPRHRQDVFSGGTSSHRAAPGGRGEGSIVGFAFGRGRSNCSRTSDGRLSGTGPIGAACDNKTDLHGKSGHCVEIFRYPRGKLLDIYKQKALAFIDNIPVDLEDVPSLTGSSSIQPLAFVSPDAEELALLDGIWNGNIVSSEVCSDSTKYNFGRVDKKETERALDQDKCKAEINGAVPGGTILSVVEEVCHHYIGLPGCNQTEPERTVCQMSSIYADGRMADPSLSEDAKFEDMNSDLPIDDGSILPDDSKGLLDSFILKTSQSDLHHQSINNETKQSRQRTPHELSLFYRDPQGDIQGPFLGVDIVSWFEQGFFDADLPVCLSDSPEGSPFMRLREVMPYLTHKSQAAPSALTGNASEDSINLGASTPSGFIDAGVTKGQQGISIVSLEPEVQLGICKPDDLVNPQYEMLPLSISETTDIVSSGKQNFRESADQDVEVVLYSGRPFARLESSTGKLADYPPNLPTSSNANCIQGNHLEESSLNVIADGDLHPLGLLWSELKGANSKGPLSSNLSGLSDRENTFSPATGGEGSFAGYRQKSVDPAWDSSVHDAWSGKFSAGSGSNAAYNALHESRLQNMELQANQFSLKERSLSQLFQNTQLPQHGLLFPHEGLHLTGIHADEVHGSLQDTLFKNQGHLDAEHLLQLRSQPKQQIQQLQYLKQQSEQEQHIQQLQQLQQPCDQQMHNQQFHLQQFCDQQQLRHYKFQLLQHMQQQQQEEQKQIILKQLMDQQLMGQQLCNPEFQASHINPLREGNRLNFLSRQPHLHEMQQSSPPVLRQYDPSIDRLIQANLGHNLDERSEDLFQAVPHANHGEMHTMEHLGFDPQQEQRQSQQFTKTLRSWPDVEQDRRIGGVWSVDEHGQFVGAASYPQHIQSVGPSPLDFLQHQRTQQGPYQLNSESFERTNPLSGNILGSNTDLVNILPQFERQGIHGLHDETLSSAKMGRFPSAVPFHQNLIDRQWSDTNEGMPQNMVGLQLNQLSLEDKHQNKDMNFKFNHHVEDARSWAPLAGNDGISRLSSNNLLQQNLALQSSRYSGFIHSAALPSYETNEASLPLSGSAIDHSRRLQDRVFGCNSLLDPSHLQGIGHSPQWQLMNANSEDHTNRIETHGGFAFSTVPESFVKYQGSVFTRNGSDEVIDDSKVLNYEPMNGISGKKHDYELFKVAAFESDPPDCRVEPVHNSYLNHGVLEDNASIRHASVSKSGGNLSFSNYGVGVDNSFARDRVINRVPAILVEEGGDSLMKPSEGPQILASRVSSSEVAFNQQTREINLSKFSSSEDGRQQLRRNSPSPVPETHTTGKDGDKEASFIDKLKNTQKTTAAECNTNTDTQDAGSAQNTRRKGKKGRQIDPSLLGFKVQSNRRLKGEIQRFDD
ncbi:putative GYF domain-containing protein [Dioscorea sansibarensis]